MINYDRFLFASAPRTGTTWFLKAMHTLGLTQGSKATVHIPIRNEYRSTHTPIVTMMRHPVDWLRSYYCSIYPGKTGIEVVDCLYDPECNHPNIDSFLEWYLENRSGQVTKISYLYEGTICMRLEDLPWSFFEFLDLLGISATKQQVEAIKALGSQNTTRVLPDIPKILRRKIADSERSLMDNLDYCI